MTFCDGHNNNFLLKEKGALHFKYITVWAKRLVCAYVSLNQTRLTDLVSSAL